MKFVLSFKHGSKGQPRVVSTYTARPPDDSDVHLVFQSRSDAEKWLAHYTKEAENEDVQLVR